MVTILVRCFERNLDKHFGSCLGCLLQGVLRRLLCVGNHVNSHNPAVWRMASKKVSVLEEASQLIDCKLPSFFAFSITALLFAAFSLRFWNALSNQSFTWPIYGFKQLLLVPCRIRWSCSRWWGLEGRWLRLHRCSTGLPLFCRTEISGTHRRTLQINPLITHY